MKIIIKANPQNTCFDIYVHLNFKLVLHSDLSRLSIFSVAITIYDIKGNIKYLHPFLSAVVDQQ